MQKTQLITVLIATKNRPREIIPCVRSILKNTYTTIEILVVDQSKGNETDQGIQQLNNKKIVYIRHPKGGKSDALNIGLQQAHGTIIAFTDDDCIASNDWLYTIALEFASHNCEAVFGRTLPYKPKNHPRLICPCVFTHKKKKIITTPQLHYKHIGLGNNMALRSSIFSQIGKFKNWLGPGSIGRGAEDAEFTQRILISNKLICYCPDMIMYHNKWLTQTEMRRQQLSYVCGEMACYGYYALRGYAFARNIVKDDILDSLYDVKHLIKQIVQHKIFKSNDWAYICQMAFIKTHGFLIGIFYGIKEITLDIFLSQVFANAKLR